MSDHARTDDREVVAESVSHYRVQRLSDGTIRVRSGGHVTHGETYYEALARYAEWQQSDLEDLPEHLREDKWKCVSYDTVNPETEDVVANDADWIRESVIADVIEGEADPSASGAWLAHSRETGADADPELGAPVRVYRLWDTVYSKTWEGSDG